MKQVVQSVRTGALRVVDVPVPVIGPTQVLVRTLYSVVSGGTERAARKLASASLLTKARARPDLVRQVIHKARRDGFVATANSVRARLDEDMALGYSAAGRVVEVGEAVANVSVGQLVATGGAPHAEYQMVAGNLAVPVPAGVEAGDAAFATIASVALHGLRLAQLGAGSRVCVIGLGLLGQLAARLGLAAGYEVSGIDVDAAAARRASASGILGLVEAGDDTTRTILDWSRGRGADAVLITAATTSSAAVLRSTAVARDRASVVVIGDVGLDLDRRPFYEKELALRFARSYGPGRYEMSYEDWGVDYPVGYVRWTEGRNLEAVLDLLARRALDVSDLVSHRFDISEAAKAYEVVEGKAGPLVAVQLGYPGAPSVTPPRRIDLANNRRFRSSPPGVGLLGAGAFARATLVPAMEKAGFNNLVAVASASGVSARHLAERAGFKAATSNADEVINDPNVDLVVIATPHSTHADLTCRALRAGKHVFCEKPIALGMDELDKVEAAWRKSPGILMVGFNRRFSPALAAITKALQGSRGRLVMSYRVNAGPIPADHFYADRREGGRLIGEVCHFVDTCIAIADEDPLSVAAFGSGGESLLSEDLVVTMKLSEGSIAAITYASAGHALSAKERLEVLGRGHTVVLDDFNQVTVDGDPLRNVPAGKGHMNELQRLGEALSGGGWEPPTTSMLSSMRATLRAASALGTSCSTTL